MRKVKEKDLSSYMNKYSEMCIGVNKIDKSLFDKFSPYYELITL